MIHQKRKHKIWECYTEDEAKERDIEYVFWRDTTVDTEWILTDDKYVIPIIGKLLFRGDQIYESPFGKFAPRHKFRLIHNEKSPQNNQAYWKNKGGCTTPKKRQLGRLLAIFPESPQKAYELAYGNKLTKTNNAYFKRLMKDEFVMREMRKTLKEIATDLKMDENWLLERWKSEAEDKKARPQDRQSALKEIEELLDYKKKIVIQEKRSLQIGPDTIRALQEEKTLHMKAVEEETAEIIDVQPEDVEETSSEEQS